MKKTIFVFLATLLYSVSLACSCQSTGQSLCESFQNDSTATLVCVCKKIESYAYGFKVERIANVYGTETRDTFWVWGDNGGLCRMYDIWQVGDTMVLSLQKCDTMGNWIENPDYPLDVESLEDYQVSGCGVYFANVQNGYVVGNITSATVQQIPLNTFLASNCFKQGTGIAENKSKNIFSVFPQPANNLLNINFNAQTNNAKYVIYNTVGQIEKEGVLSNSNNVIYIETLLSGIYNMVIYNDKFRASKRLLVSQ